MRHLTIFGVVVSLILMALVPIAAAQAADDLAGMQWQLVSIDGEALIENTIITLEFGLDGTASGSGGCNGYGSAYTVIGETLRFEGVMSTMMACEGGITEQEIAYFAALQTATRYEITADQLVITYGDHQQLVFSRLIPLPGSAWRLVSLADETVIGDTSLTLTFGEDTSISGHAGCNTFSGSYTLDGNTITFDSLISTRMACQAEGIMTQEQTYLRALQTATGYQLDTTTDSLTITYGDGEMLGFARIKSLANTGWELVSYGGTPVIADSHITLNFDDLNGATGNGGCNTYGGSYTVEDDAITFGALISTEMACSVLAQEQVYFNALASATHYTMDGEWLIITYGDNQKLIFAP